MIFEKIIAQKFNKLETIENKYLNYRKGIIKKLFLKELDNNIDLKITNNLTQNNSDLTWNYIIWFNNKNITIEDIYPLLEKNKKLIREWIKMELEILENKISNLDEYILYKRSKNNITINKDKIEFILKFLVNYIYWEIKYNLEELKYNSIFENELWFFDINSNNSNIENIIEKYFLEEAEILKYLKNDNHLLNIRQYIKNKKQYEFDFINHYLGEWKYIIISAPIVKTKWYIESQIINETNEKLKEDLIFFQKKLFNNEYFIINKNIIRIFINKNFDFNLLNKSLTNSIIRKFNIKDKDLINKVNNLNTYIDIKFSNHKNIAWIN